MAMATRIQSGFMAVDDAVNGDGMGGCAFAGETHDGSIAAPPSSAPLELHVEARISRQSRVSFETARTRVEVFLRETHVCVKLNSPIAALADIAAIDDFIPRNVAEIRICEARGGEIPSDEIVYLDECTIEVHVYQDAETGGASDAPLKVGPPAQDGSAALDGDAVAAEDQGGAGGSLADAARVWSLPSPELEGVWESLVFDDALPQQLLDFVYSSLLFSDLGVDANLVSVHRLVLLHGPPGTGKTTLCRALAQKLAIRLSDRFCFGKLVEINANGLFSKFFAESGKMVSKLFQHLHDMLADETVFMCVLMDEVESLSAARKAAASGLEPSDAIRTVNALLTQLDRLRRRKNVLVMATSNVTEAIDPAFIDRADIKQYVGDPSPRAIYTILSTSITELIRCGIITTTNTTNNDITNDNTDDGERLVPLHELDVFGTSCKGATSSIRLRDIAESCRGWSGRTLRKLPLLAHAHHVRARTIRLSRFLDALEATVTAEQSARGQLMMA